MILGNVPNDFAFSIAPTEGSKPQEYELVVERGPIVEPGVTGIEAPSSWLRQRHPLTSSQSDPVDLHLTSIKPSLNLHIPLVHYACW